MAAVEHLLCALVVWSCWQGLSALTCGSLLHVTRVLSFVLCASGDSLERSCTVEAELKSGGSLERSCTVEAELAPGQESWVWLRLLA